MTPESALSFRNAFRDARLKVLANAENYQELLFVLERLGMHLADKKVRLADAKPYIMKLVELWSAERGAGGIRHGGASRKRALRARPPCAE